MQEFLTNNTVSCNLMSLTGYRTLIILSALMESPKTNDEINEYFYNNQYIKEKFSSDTLRLYINSLRAVGCEITKANKSNSKKYELLSHPFTYGITKSQLNAIEKIYKNVYDKISAKELLAFDNFFEKLSGFVTDTETKEFIQGLSAIKHLNKTILEDLILHCKNKNQIIILYNSPKSGKKEIEIIADKLEFKSEKLYLYGNNLTHKEYSFFLVEKISKIQSIKIMKSSENFDKIKVIYENYNLEYKIETRETLLEKTSEKLVIELTADNEFDAIQKILYKAEDCKVISPENIKKQVVDKLKLMVKSYEKV